MTQRRARRPAAWLTRVATKMPSDDRPGLAEARGEHEGEQLRLVAHFGERDDAGGDEEGFHEETPAGERERNDARHPRPNGGCAVKGLAKSKYRLRHGPRPKSVDASPFAMKGGYSPMTACIVAAGMRTSMAQLLLCFGATAAMRRKRTNHKHSSGDKAMEALKQGTDVLFILLGAIMVLAMHAGFAFLELGTVRKKNQVNALVKILVDFAVSTVAYFFIGYCDRLRRQLLRRRRDARAEERLRAGQVLLPADLRRGDPGDRLRRHRRARALRPAARRDRRCWWASSIRSSKASPGTRRFGVQALDQGADRRRVPRLRRLAWSCTRSAAGSALAAVLLLGARSGRYRKDGARQRASAVEHPVPRARRVGAVGRLVRLQRDERADHRQDLGPGRGELADGDGGRHAGGAALLGRNDPGFVHNGPLAGLVAICAGSDVMHPLGALVVGGVAGAHLRRACSR